jgi:hypothetical protein
MTLKLKILMLWEALNRYFVLNEKCKEMYFFYRQYPAPLSSGPTKE